MNLEILKTKRVGILGYGQEGQSVARYLSRHGIDPVLFDKKQSEQALDFKIYSGNDYLEHFSEVDVIFRSPGFWRLQQELLDFEQAGGEITSQTKYFFENSPAKIVGVTGTKGKGTTTTLAFKMAQTAGINAYLTGNIGQDQPLDFLEDLTSEDLVYYELSSFQLQDLEQSPHIGIVLMTTADHLDIHSSIDEYHKAKNSITKYQSNIDFAIINKDFPASSKIGEQGNGKKLWFSNTKADFGLEIQDNKIIAKGLGEFNVPDGEILNLDQLILKGRHNLQNISAALLAGIACNFNLETLINTAKNFVGLEHRLEFVDEKKGVRFYNDSFSTTPETAIAAIDSFEEPEILILGGSEKFLDYSELGKKIHSQNNICKVFLIGETANKIKQSLDAAGVKENLINMSCANFEQIFQELKTVATPGSVVLLSPATASFDMFKNYKERGNAFKELVKNW